MKLLKNSRGFTLIELMVVVVILGLLAALVLPKMFGRVGESKQKTSKAQIEMFSTALGMFRLDVGRYPSTTEGLLVLRTRPSGIDNWKGPYLQKDIPDDPWGRPYHYTSPGTHDEYDLYSYGADNTEGGEGENADIVSWK